MAEITKKNLFTFDVSEWQGKTIDRVKVGHNRELSFGYNGITQQPELRCYLHGHNVCTFTRIPGDGIEVTLEDHDWRTVTTRQAMNDFLEAMGLNGGVSFAKGEFTAYVQGVQKEGTDTGRIYYTFQNVG